MHELPKNGFVFPLPSGLISRAETMIKDALKSEASEGTL